MNDTTKKARELPEFPDAADSLRIVNKYGDPDYAEAGDNYYTGAQMREYAEAAILAALSEKEQAPVAYSVLQIGSRGSAYDTPGACRAYTYREQPGNDDAWLLGRAASAARAGGDPIDYGLSLLQKLQEHGFGVFKIGEAAPQPASAMPELLDAPQPASAMPELLDAIKEYRLWASTTNRESVARLDAAMLAASKGGE